jgi:hypothetical protein
MAAQAIIDGDAQSSPTYLLREIQEFYTKTGALKSRGFSGA